MEAADKQTPDETASGREKKRLLYQKQKSLLDTFLAKGAISNAQYDKSLRDMTEKMGIEPGDD